MNIIVFSIITGGLISLYKYKYFDKAYSFFYNNYTYLKLFSCFYNQQTDHSIYESFIWLNYLQPSCKEKIINFFNSKLIESITVTDLVLTQIRPVCKNIFHTFEEHVSESVYSVYWPLNCIFSVKYLMKDVVKNYNIKCIKGICVSKTTFFEGNKSEIKFKFSSLHIDWDKKSEVKDEVENKILKDILMKEFIIMPK
jgi:hypothetical protein